MLNFGSGTPNEITQLIVDLWSNAATRRQIVLMHGRPGIGKTKLVNDICVSLGATLIDLRLMQLEAPDLRGQTMVDTETMVTRHIRPEFLPEYTEDPNAPTYVLFLDEVMGASDTIRKAAFELLLERRIGPHRIGNNVFMVAAGNTLEDGTNIVPMDTPTADRFLHVEVQMTVEGVIEYAMQRNWNPNIIAFLKSNMNVLDISTEQLEAGHMALPSPRSFERWSEIMDAGIRGKSLELALKGWCGNQIGQLFMLALEDMESQYDFKELLDAKPKDRRYPTSQFAQLSLASNLIAWANSDPEQVRFAMSIMMDMPGDSGLVRECKLYFVNTILAKMPPSFVAKFAFDEKVSAYIEGKDELFRATSNSPSDTAKLAA